MSWDSDALLIPATAYAQTLAVITNKTMRLPIIICIGLFLSERLVGQTTDNSIEKIMIYVQTVDSLSDIRTEEALLIVRLEEGYVTNTRKGKFQSSGFSLKTVTSNDSDTVFLIRYSDSLEKNLIESYYFKSDRLVFAKIELLQNMTTDYSPLYLQQKYYNEDKVIFSTVDKNRFRKKYKWRIDFDPKENAHYFLTRYRETQK